MRRAAIALLALIVLAPAARGEPPAMAPAARAHLEDGLRAYAARDWGEAIAEFRTGYAIDPHPDFLFPWAQATRLSGDCAAALPLYRRALAAAADEDRADIERLIQGCEEEAARARPAPEGPAREAAASARVPARVQVDAGERAASPPAWYADRLGGGLAIGAAIGLAAGAGFLVAASRAEGEAQDAGTLDDFVAATDRADQRRVVGAVALGAGAGLAAAAVLRYAWVARRSAHEADIAVTPAGDGAAVWLRGRF